MFWEVCTAFGITPGAHFEKIAFQAENYMLESAVLSKINQYRHFQKGMPMKFSELITLLTAADMASDVQISQDCDIEDLNLMDREYRDFNDSTVYFIDADQIGPGTQFPVCLL